MTNNFDYMNDCTHNCHTCGANCGTEKKKDSFFDTLDKIADAYGEIGEDEMLRILNETVEQWEKEMAEDEAKEAIAD